MADFGSVDDRELFARVMGDLDRGVGVVGLMYNEFVFQRLARMIADAAMAITRNTGHSGAFVAIVPAFLYKPALEHSKRLGRSSPGMTKTVMVVPSGEVQVLCHADSRESELRVYPVA